MASDISYTSLRVGLGFSDIPKNMENFLRGIIGNRTNYYDSTFTAFYSGENVQPHSFDIDSGIHVSIENGARGLPLHP